MEKKSYNDYEWEFVGANNEELSLSGHNRQQMLELLNQTGKGFCLAKWTQVTMHLGNGLTHSCHHPGAHKIPLEELKENPSALHNTNFKKERRKEMLNGERPAECDFCWRVEDDGEISDRVLKSIPKWSSPYHDKISKLKGDEDIYPTYVEVSFGRTCNFACSYCGPPFSSKWEQDIKEKGPYDVLEFAYNPIKKDEVHIPHNEHNPYIEAFWKWFPEAYKHMHTFRITGGEPLLIKDTFKVIDFLIENPNPNLHFAINSNACPPGDIWDKFIEKIKILTDNHCVAKFELFTSAEATSKRCDYIRDGMDYDMFVANIEKFLANTSNTKVIFMCTFNVLSISTFKELLEWILSLKRRFSYQGLFGWLEEEGYKRVDDDSHEPFVERGAKNKRTHNRVAVDVPYLRHPQFLDANICTKEMIDEYLIPAVDFMYQHLGNGEWYITQNFDDHECLKLKRNVIGCIIKAKNIDPKDGLSSATHIARNRAKFAKFIQEYDQRRGKNFLETFPEYEDFYEICLREYQKHYGAPETDRTFEKMKAD